MERPLKRIGHKGADAITPGNTLESFRTAVEIGVDAIEFDVLRPRGDFDEASDWRNASAGPAYASGPLLISHDWADAARRDPITLAEALDAFLEPPLDGIEFNLDLKVAGREDEIAAALRERGLIDRAMISTQELNSLHAMREIEPELRRGWTFPRVTRPWDRKIWARPFLIAALAAMRRRLPGHATRTFPGIEPRSMWVYHPLVTSRLADACEAAGLDLYAWTVDDAARIDELKAMGVTGIVTNDPRLLNPS
jgi:glycerophosphoryl diester phosphodiesterase